MGDIYEKIQEILGDETDEFIKNEKYHKLITEIYAMGAKYGAEEMMKGVKAFANNAFGYVHVNKEENNEQTAQ